MMTDLMRDYIRLREVAGSAKPVFERVEEIEINVDTLIVGPISCRPRNVPTQVPGYGQDLFPLVL